MPAVPHRLSLWTWLLPLPLLHLATWLSLATQFTDGAALWYPPFALALVFALWWGPRVLLAAAAVPTSAGRELLDGEGRAAFVQRLRGWLAGHCDPIALPRRWRFLDAMPADARGKTSERALTALFRPRMPPPLWLRRDAHGASATLIATAELAAFEGHFPQAPILPGVVLLDWAVRLGRDAFGLSFDVQRVEALKFQQLVRPGTELTVDLALVPGRLDFRFTSAHGVHAAGRLRFDEAGT